MYAIDGKVEIGDIILINSQTILGKGISIATAGKYSHVAVVISPTQVIEAIGKSGVQVTSLLRFEFNDKSNVSVKRFKYKDELTFEKLKEIAVSYQNKGYDLTSALLSVIPIINQSEDSKFFCSQLVANLYKSMNIELFNKDAHKVFPNDFDRCEKLYDVTNDVVLELKEHIKKRYENRPELWLPLDGDGSGVSEDAKLHRKFIEKAQKVFKKYDYNIPKNLNDIIDIQVKPLGNGDVEIQTDLDYEITNLYLQSGILQNLEKSLKKPKTLQSEVTEDVKNYGITFAKEELITLREILNYYSKNILDIVGLIDILIEINEKYTLQFPLARKAYYELINLHILAFTNELEETILYLEGYINEYIN